MHVDIHGINGSAVKNMKHQSLKRSSTDYRKLKRWISVTEVQCVYCINTTTPPPGLNLYMQFTYMEFLE